MARREITDRSTAAEKAQAANELRQAQRDYNEWFEYAKSEKKPFKIKNIATFSSSSVSSYMFATH